MKVEGTQEINPVVLSVYDYNPAHFWLIPSPEIMWGVS